MNKYPLLTVLLVIVFSSLISIGAWFGLNTVGKDFLPKDEPAAMEKKLPATDTPLSVGEATPQDELQKSLEQGTEKEVDPLANWKQYDSPHGYSFKIPPEYRLVERENENDNDPNNQTWNVQIVLVNEAGEAVGPPKMIINVIPSFGQVGFGLWEGAEWEHYHEVMSTFRFGAGVIKPLAPPAI